MNKILMISYPAKGGAGYTPNTLINLIRMSIF